MAENIDPGPEVVKTILQNFGGAICKDQRLARLLHAFEAQSFDGTEIHHVVDRELRGLEHRDAASNITRAIDQKYRDTIPVHVAVELFAGLHENGERE